MKWVKPNPDYPSVQHYEILCDDAGNKLAHINKVNTDDGPAFLWGAGVCKAGIHPDIEVAKRQAEQAVRQ